MKKEPVNDEGKTLMTYKKRIDKINPLSMGLIDDDDKQNCDHYCQEE